MAQRKRVWRGTRIRGNIRRHTEYAYAYNYDMRLQVHSRCVHTANVRIEFVNLFSLLDTLQPLVLSLSLFLSLFLYVLFSSWIWNYLFLQNEFCYIFLLFFVHGIAGFILYQKFFLRAVVISNWVLEKDLKRYTSTLILWNFFSFFTCCFRTFSLGFCYWLIL